MVRGSGSVCLDIVSFVWVPKSAWPESHSIFAFWKFLEFFSRNIFDPYLVESTDVEFPDMEG
jgi:hypothetical protein